MDDDKNILIEEIILRQKDFHLLPRDEDGYCVYEGDLLLESLKTPLLPENLKVNGALYCSFCGIDELPNGLIVKGILSCNNNNLITLPDGLKIHGALACNNNNITHLPSNLSIGGDFYCAYNKLTSFPDNINIGNDLFCSGNNITTMIDCNIGGSVYMSKEDYMMYTRAIKINKNKNNG